MPDFLGGPAMRPLRVHERIPRRGASRSAKLSEVEQLEAVGAEEPDPLPYGKRELHCARVGPVQAVQPEGIAQEMAGGGAVVVGKAQGQDRPVLEEDES